MADQHGPAIRVSTPTSNSRPSVVSSRTRACGWNIAAGLTTAGHAQNPASAQRRSHGRPGKTRSTIPEEQDRADDDEERGEKLRGSLDLARGRDSSPSRRSSPAIAYHPGGV